MSYPMHVSIHVPETQYYIEIDSKKVHCNIEPAHCHICDIHGIRVAEISLTSRTFKTKPVDLSEDDQIRIITTVSTHRYEIEEAYLYNQRNGID